VGATDHLLLSGAPLKVNNSTFSGTSVTVRESAADLRNSTFVNCRLVVERGAQLTLLASTLSGSAKVNSATFGETQPAVTLHSGSSAKVDSATFENMHSVSSGAAFLVNSKL
jgi:hypothetical protein